MKSIFCILLLSLGAAVAAQAGVVSVPDGMDIYFDPAGTTYEIEQTAFSVVPFYVVLTDPTFDAIEGYEFSYEIAGNVMVTSMQLAGENRIDLHYKDGEHIVSLPQPMDVGAATVLATVSLFLLDAEEVDLTLKGMNPRTADGFALPAVTVDGLPRTMTTWSWDAENEVFRPSAVINSCCIQPADEFSWDQVKSLYR